MSITITFTVHVEALILITQNTENNSHLNVRYALAEF